MAFFVCDLPVAGCCKQFLVAILALAMCGIPCTSGRLFATVYLQWFTCDDNFHQIKLMIVSSHMSVLIKAY